MKHYLASTSDEEAITRAISYLHGPAHEWWIIHKETEDGFNVTTWSTLQQALIARFETLHKETIPRDKVAKLKQLKDVATFDDDFQRVFLDGPHVSVDEQIDRYTRGHKSHI